MEAEVVEVGVAPATGVTIDQANEDFLARERPQVDGDTAKVFLLDTGGAREDCAGILAHQLNAGGRMRSAADEEGRPGMGHLEGNRRQRALWLVAVQLVAADPVVALVLTLH